MTQIKAKAANWIRAIRVIRGQSILICMLLATASHAATIAINRGDNVQDAINRAGVGGTVILSQPGNYPVPGTLKLLNGQTIRGTTRIVATPYLDTTTVPGFSIPSAKCSAADESIIAPPAGVRAIWAADDCTIESMSFIGSAIGGKNGDLDGPSGTVRNLHVRGVSFDLKSIQPGKSTAIQAWGFYGLSIADCVFRDSTGSLDTFIYFYAATGKIERCDFAGAGDHIHPANCDSSTRDFEVNECHFGGQRRNPVEYQGGGSGFKLTDCWSDAPSYVAPLALMGFTLPADQSTGTRVAGCVVLATGQSNPANRQRVGFEFASVDFAVSNSYVKGVRKAVTVTNAKGTGSVRDCCFEDLVDDPPWDTNGGKVTYMNVADQAIKRNLLERGRPGPLRPFMTTQGNPPPPPPPPPAPGPTTSLSDYQAVSAERDSLRAILRAVDSEADKIKGLIPR